MTDRNQETEKRMAVVLVTSSGCHLCEMAKDVLGRLSKEYPIGWREIDMTTEEGREVVRAHRAPFPPVLLVGDRFHCYGRVSEKKLRKALDRAMKER